MDTQLRIEHAGRRIEVPISEILHFASRWERDREQQVAARIEANWIGLDIYPYPLYSVGLDDPDVRDTAWWVE
jgi:hypothetical protein